MAEMEALADQADIAEGSQTPDIEQPEAETQEVEGQQAPAEEVAKAEIQEPSPPTPEAAKPQSKEDKAQEREAKAWQKIEAEKAEVARIKQEAQAERQAVEAEKREVEKRNIYRDPKTGFSAEEYERVAKELKDEGETEKAAYAEQKAREIRETGSRKEKELGQAEWLENMNAVIKTRKEFLDRDSPEGQALKAVFDEYPQLGQRPDGFKQAVRLYDLKKTADSVPELQAKLETLTKEKERLESLTAISGGNPTGARTPSGKKPSEMTGRDIEKLMEQADDDGVPFGR